MQEMMGESPVVSSVNKTVVCFDRDWTVSVNPPMRNEAVPLAWVKRLAHSTPQVDVWATGNQMLTAEATIHGVSYAGAVWETLFETPVGKAYPSERDEHYFPARDDRLRVIQDCYEQFHDREDLRLIVVDDSDLSAMESEGWEYYTAWEFVPAAFEDEFSEFFTPHAPNEHWNISDAGDAIDEGNEKSVSLSAPDQDRLESLNPRRFDGEDNIYEKMARLMVAPDRNDST